MMALEMFIGELDARKVKEEIHQTKFWPVYGRDTVRTRSTSSGRSTGEGENFSSGESASDGHGESFQPVDWESGSYSAPFTSTSRGTGMSSMHGHHSNTTDFEGTAEGIADVPIYRPEPFVELSSRQFYTHEEQVMEWTAALKEQLSGHCFIKIHHKRTQLLRVPFIREYRTPQYAIMQYEARKKRAAGAVAGHIVDAAIAAEEAKLAATVTPAPVKPEKPAGKKSMSWDDLLGRE